MVPTKDRNVSSVYIEIQGEGILFDCGEGTQRQMNIAGLNRNKIKYIFISHWHADHMAGLLGLIQTIQNNGVEGLIIFGPKGSEKHMKHIMQSSIFDEQMHIETREFDCKEETVILNKKNFSVSAINLEHGVPCLGFALKEATKRKVLSSKLQKEGLPQGPLYAELQEGKKVTFEGKTFDPKAYTKKVPGKKIVYITDTAFVAETIALAKDADLLLAESTYCMKHEDKAEEYNHMTSTQSAQIASHANVKKLVLTHISQRYKSTEDLLQEAQDIFPQTELAFDFMKISL